MSIQHWKSDTLEGLGKGSRVWLRSGTRSWELGTLQSNTNDNECSLVLDSSLGEATGKSVTANVTDVVPANPAIMELVPDLTSLSFLNEPSILHTLRQRYSEDTIYTHAGPVLIAINPFKSVGLYTPDHVQLYVNRPATGTQSQEGYEPHIFLTADKAYKQVIIEYNLHSTSINECQFLRIHLLMITVQLKLLHHILADGCQQRITEHPHHR